MAAGRLLHRLIFQKRLDAGDGYGNPVSGEWIDQFTVHASIRPLKGSEAVQAARLGGVQPVILSVRRSSQTLAVAPDWRAVDARNPETVYAITAPPADMTQKRQYLDILATIGVAA